MINNLSLANSNSHSKLINVKRFRDVNYNTSLHMAVLKNNYKFVNYFIKKKLNINKKKIKMEILHCIWLYRKEIMI